jgi:diguanylate cyclase (GGDEF)-like protein
MIKRWLTPIVAVALAAAGLAAVMLLEHQADSYRQAEVTLANVKARFTIVGVSPLQLVDGLATPTSVKHTMAVDQREILSQLRVLLTARPAPALRGIMGPILTDFTAVDEVRALLTRDPTLSDPQSILLAVHLALSADTAGEAVTAAMERATQEYRSDGSGAQTRSLVGAVSVIAALLAVFLFFYGRWVRLLAATKRDAHTDSLTGLGNRRALIENLTARLPEADPDHPLILTMYDLDGFKSYNDTFGHLAGDALLTRFGERLAETVGGIGRAYRMGGDEFCCVAEAPREQLDWQLARGMHALSAHGEVFEIGCSAGSVVIPDEGASADAVLHLADQRMYEQKTARTASASRQSADVLEVLNEKDGALRDHTGDVADLAQETARALGLSEQEVERVRLAAELHDVGKSAIPDTILNKPAKLDAEEWEFIRNHTLIGERIVRAAPSLALVAELVRASHERVDGHGYPDGLGGASIPIGARIVAACDAFDAMVSPRPYRECCTVDEALAELRRCRGAQFDAEIVDVLCEIIARRRAASDLAA